MELQGLEQRCTQMIQDSVHHSYANVKTHSNLLHNCFRLRFVHV